MEVYVELPTTSKRRVERVIERGRGLVDGYFFPDGPGGEPVVDPLAVGVFVRLSSPDAKVIVSLRLADVNALKLLSVARAAEEFGLEGLLLVQGDKPKVGLPVSHVSSEEALEIARKHVNKLKLGLLVSLRYDVTKIRERLSLRPDFVAPIHFTKASLSKMHEVSRDARGAGVKVLPFALLEVGKNVELFRALGQSGFSEGELAGLLESLEGIVDGLIISSPLELQRAIELLGALRRK
ncbi:MAG: hypothetical protein ABWK00_05240 [Desulfurococcaceae archaeon]